MKKVLFGTTALVLSAGVAAADVTLNGNGRMGVIDGFGDSDLTFTSRIRFNFAASGETDGGLSFGGSLASDDSGDAGDSGTIFIEGAFGKLTMGDVDGGAKAAVGHVSGVGLTGLGDLNEMTYIANVGQDTPGALYEYSTGDLTFYVSADQPNQTVVLVEDDPATPADETVIGDTGDAYAVGLSYGFGNYTVALGYEDNDDFDDGHIIGGVTAGFGDATVKVVYGDAGDAGDQMSISLDYVFGATTVTAFYADDEELGGAEGYGIGASYDLGGGASLKGGYAQNESSDEDAFDFGISMSF